MRPPPSFESLLERNCPPLSIEPRCSMHPAGNGEYADGSLGRVEWMRPMSSPRCPGPDPIGRVLFGFSGGRRRVACLQRAFCAQAAPREEREPPRHTQYRARPDGRQGRGFSVAVLLPQSSDFR
jgi:hypothetical protein